MEKNYLNLFDTKILNATFKFEFKIFPVLKQLLILF